MEAAMPCKLRTTKRSSKHRESDSGSNKIQKSKQACIVEAHESTGKRLEGTLSKDHEDRTAEKGFNSLINFYVVHKFIPMLQAMKVPDAKASMANDQGKEQIGGHPRDTTRAKNSPFCYADGHLSSQECGV